MATGRSTATPTHNRELHGQPPASYDEYIYQQLRRTQNYVRLVDIGEALLTVGVATLAYLLVVSIVDHWLLRGGLSTFGRFLAWGTLFVGVLVYLVRKILPHMLSRVSWLYAADTIERARPSLKNSLLNFLLLRQDPRGVPAVVYQGMEQRAATDLSQLQVESAVDRSRVVRIGYVLAAVVLACVIYIFASPKALLPSFGRVLAPWSDIAPQTRVTIQNVEPGDTEALLLSRLEIRAEVSGLRQDETVTLFYSSLDQRAVDVPIPMFVPEGQIYHSCQLPDDPSGLSQDVSYRIEAGDCTSAIYKVQVVVAPTIHVKKIEYTYPKYTRLEPRSTEGIGDIKALEGTQVVIHAEASHAIGTAYVQLDGVRNQTVPMRSSGKSARCKVVLHRKIVGSESLPQWTSYYLTMTTPDDRKNENPIVHRIDITPDLVPLVEVIKPEHDEVSVPLDGQLDIEIRARDPDFQLGDLRLTAKKSAIELLDQPLADDQRPFDGSIRTTYRFVPADHKLQPGDVVRYAAIATDNKKPTGNRSETDDYTILITEPEHPDTISRQNDKAADQDTDQDSATDSEGGQDGDGQGGDGQGGNGQEGGKSSEEGGETQDGSGKGSPESQDGAENSEADGSNGKGSETKDGSAGNQNQNKQEGDQTGTNSEGQDGEGGKGESGQQVERQEGAGQGTSPDDRQAGQQRDGSSQEAEGPVDNPGDAFEKVAEYMREKDEDQVASAQRSDNDPTSDPAGEPSGENSEGGRPGDESANGDDAQGGEDGVGEQAGSTAGDEPEQSPAKPDEQQGVGEKPGATPDGEGQQSETGSRPEDGEGGGGESKQGDSPTPPPAGEARPRDKTGDAKQGNEQDGPSDSSVSDRDANSAEGDDGSKSGQGKKGGGQSSDQDGTGGSGNNTAAETGGNASQESGMGDDSPQAGDASASNKPTGNKSDQAGEASEGDGSSAGDSKSEGNEQQSDGADQQQPNAEQPDAERPSADASREGTEQPSASRNGKAGAGNRTGDGNPDGDAGPRGSAPPDDGPRTEPGADDANLDYARKQTDLVLDYLQDQLDKGGVDEDLKKRFGWTDEQFADFVRRYGQLRDRVKSSGDEGRAARQEFDDALRSLGLRPPSQRVRTGTPEQKKADDLQQSGRSRPPQELQEQFEAFRKDAFKDE